MAFDPSIIPDAQKITLTCESSQISTDQTDFPLTVVLDGVGPLHADLFANLGANSKRLSIEASGVQCPVEIESWDAVGETAVLHTKVPTYTTASDPELVLSYDNSQPDNTDYVGDIGSSAGQSVWDSSFDGVYHPQDPSGTIIDSTANANNLTSGGSMTGGDLVSGLYADAIEFDGSNDYLQGLPDIPAQNTLEVFFNPSTVEETAFLSWDESGGNHTYDFKFGIKANGTLYGLWDTDTEDGTEIAGVSSVSTGSWYYGVAAQDSDTFYLYLDESLDNSAAISAHLSGSNPGRVADPYSDGYADTHYHGLTGEIRISNIKRSADWLTLTNLSLRDQLITWSAYDSGGSGPVILVAGLEQLWSSPVQSGLQQLWDVLQVLQSGLEQIFGSPQEAGLKQPWHMAPVLQAGLDQRWGHAQVLQAALVQKWKQARVLSRGLQQPWVDATIFQAGLEQEFGVAGTVLESGLEQPWAVRDTTVLQAGLQQIWLGGGIDVDQEYVIKVTHGGAEISPSQVRIRRSRSEFGLLATITLPGYAADLPGEVLPENYAALSGDEQDLARARAAVVIEVNGEVIAELLATEPVISESPGEATVVLTAESEPVLLDAPYAAVLQAEFGPGNMSQLAGQVCAGTDVSPVWQAVDWFVPGGVYYANNEVPLTVLQKATREIGARLAADPLGPLSVQPYYPVSRPNWWTTEPDLYLVAGANFFSISMRPLVRSGENLFTISDQLDAKQSLRYEEIDLSDGVKEIRGYEVPWSGEIVPLQTSGADWVVIEAGSEGTQLIERELVEIVGGQGRTKKPISEMIDRDYGNNTVLGAISYSEDGAIATAIAGQTLVEVTYRTRFWRWRVLDPENEMVQLFSLPAWSDLPVTIVVTFGDVAASQGFVTVEADSLLNIDVDGNVKSEFAPGDEFHFLLQHDDTMAMNSMAVSSGAVYAKTALQRRDKGQQMSFVSKAVQELPYIPAGEVDFSWYGREPAVTQDGRQISVDSHPAIGEASYAVEMHGFTLEPPPLRLLAEEEYYILIQIEMVSV